jgi:hypothetical protein
LSKPTILLVGSGFPDGQLEIRKKIGKALPKQNCKGIIMESLKGGTFHSLIQKFEKILNCNPTYIVVIFTRDGKHDAVYFELGYIAKTFGSKLQNKILILTDVKVNPLDISNYLRKGLYLDVAHYHFDQTKLPKESNSANDMIQVFLDSKNIPVS